MKQGPYIFTYRKRRRVGPRYGLWLTFAVVVAAAGIGGGALLQTRARPPISQPAFASEGTTAPVTPQIQSGLPASTDASVTETPASSENSKTPATTPSTSKVSAANDAVAKAAVSFPGAPSVKPRSIARLKPKHKYVAITLDDGYGYDPKTLKLLQKYDARCTTFLLGEWMSRNGKIVKKLDRAGFEIANHTWDHKDLTTLTDEQIRSELRRTQKVISSITGDQAPYMRPPGGATNRRVKEIAADMGYKVVMWNRTFADSSSKASPARAYRSVMERDGGVQPGDIIVCHWGSENTYEALKRILPELKAQGYEFVTVSELIADSRRSK